MIIVGVDRAEILRSPNWIWPAPSDTGVRENLDPDEWRSITDALTDNCRSMRALDGSLRLGLTGGKDSRLCLALAMNAGLGDRLDTFTRGAEDSPEVACAAEVAATAGVRHRRVPTWQQVSLSPIERPPLDTDAFWRRLRQHAYRFEAIVSPWDGLTDPSRGVNMSIQGIGGELLRRTAHSRLRDTGDSTLEELVGALIDEGGAFDPLKIVQPDVGEAQRSWLREWAHGAATATRPDVVPERFHVENRHSHWAGPLAQSTTGGVRLNPLVSAVAAQHNCELSAQARIKERLHFEVMRRAAPELVGLPFLNDIWDPDMARCAGVDVAERPFATHARPGAVLRARAHWEFLEREQTAIARLCRDAARKTDMGTICDMRRLRRLARKAREIKRAGNAKQMFSAVGVALALLSRGEPVLDRPAADS